MLAAHGSRDPASSATMRAVARRVARLWPAPVVAAFLDFDRPSIGEACERVTQANPDALSAPPPGSVPVVVPALLTNAYHRLVDLPAVLSAIPHPTLLADVLGPDALLVAALRRRLSELEDRPDGLVLIAAGTSDAVARSTVDDMARELGRQLEMPCTVGYASASAPTPGEAAVAVRALGARRIVAASYFLASGRLYHAAAESARAGGAVAVAAPLGATDEIVRLVVARAVAAVRAGRAEASVGAR